MSETTKKPTFPRCRRRRLLQPCNTSNIEKETENLFKLWILRVLVDLNAVNEVIDKDNFIKEWTIVDYLGIEVDPNNESITRKQLLSILQKKLNHLEKEKTFEQPKKLSKDVQIISDLIGLSLEEKQILTFVILLNQNQILQEATNLLGQELNSNQIKNSLSVILNIPYERVSDCFSSKSRLTTSSLLTLNKSSTYSLHYKFQFIGDSFADNMLSSSEDIDYLINEYVSRCDQGELTLNDFDYLSDELSILIPYLSKSIKKNKQGVNVLLYGFPGTGKTELVKSVATKLNIPLYEIAYSNEDGEPIEGVRRLRAYKIAQALLSDKKPLLMFDETEDVFNSGNALLSKRQSNKAWINRILETNIVPTIWITNDIYSVDQAIIRRFDMVIEIDIPCQSKRKQIIEKSAHKFLSPESVQMLATNNNIAPGVISRTAEVISFIGTKQPQKSFEIIVNQTLKAQGFSELNSMSATKLPSSYNVNYLNVDRDLNALVSGIQKNGNARLCLYGPPGTGKSAFAKYLSDKLDKPLLIKKGSDLLSKWVGEAEQNIAHAFREATTEKAVLLFDEVDGFLADRKFAQRNWEITQVNELLVQMENFNGIFIATTNLMDNLDQASLRRFDLKLKLDYLLPEQSWLLFQEECSLVDTSFSNKDRDEILRLRNLTPGDFATVRRQHAFQPIQSSKEFVIRLKEEIKVKQVGNSQLIGFVK